MESNGVSDAGEYWQDRGRCLGVFFFRIFFKYLSHKFEKIKITV